MIARFLCLFVTRDSLIKRFFFSYCFNFTCLTVIEAYGAVELSCLSDSVYRFMFSPHLIISGSLMEMWRIENLDEKCSKLIWFDRPVVLISYSSISI